MLDRCEYACTTLHHPATLCNNLQLDPLELMPLRCTSSLMRSRQHTTTRCTALRHPATYYTTLHHTATPGSALQHPATAPTRADAVALQFEFDKSKARVVAHRVCECCCPLILDCVGRWWMYVWVYLYLCMYIYGYSYIYVCVRAQLLPDSRLHWTLMYVRFISLYIYICMYTYIHIYIYACECCFPLILDHIWHWYRYIYTYIHVYIYTYIYSYVYVIMHILYVIVYIHIYIYI